MNSRQIRDLDITAEDYFTLVRFAWRRNGWSVFSANSRDEKWRGGTYGWTPLGERRYIEGNPLLDEIVCEYRKVRNDLGRIFLARDGAYFKVFEGSFEKFLNFKFVSQS